MVPDQAHITFGQSHVCLWWWQNLPVFSDALNLHCLPFFTPDVRMWVQLAAANLGFFAGLTGTREPRIFGAFWGCFTVGPCSSSVLQYFVFLKLFYGRFFFILSTIHHYTFYCRLLFIVWVLRGFWFFLRLFYCRFLFIVWVYINKLAGFWCFFWLLFLFIIWVVWACFFGAFWGCFAAGFCSLSMSSEPVSTNSSLIKHQTLVSLGASL